MPLSGQGPLYSETSTAPGGTWPSAMLVVAGSMPVSTQCTKPPASGSSTTSASFCAPPGTPLHDSGGETSSPLQLYFRRIAPPAWNAELRTLMVLAGSGAVVVPAPLPAPSPRSPPEEQAASASPTKRSGTSSLYLMAGSNHPTAVARHLTWAASQYPSMDAARCSPAGGGEERWLG